MKLNVFKIQYWFVSLLVTANLVGGTLLLTGCKNAPKRTFQVASTAAISADSAMTAWGRYVSEFHPSAEQEQKVKDAYDKYHATALVVADAGRAYAAGTGSTQGLNAALAVAAASLGDLINLVQAFGITIPSGSATGQ